MKKKELRNTLLNNRLSLSHEEILHASNAICRTVRSLEIFKQSQVVALYYPYKNEVDLRSLLAAQGKKFVFPKVQHATKKLLFKEVSSLDDFASGAFGIFEPKETMKELAVDQIDLFLVPGVGFSMKGERIGYGGGYYDATLPLRNQTSFAIGVAFNTQVVKESFAEAWDQRVDGLITETLTILLTNDQKKEI